MRDVDEPELALWSELESSTAKRLVVSAVEQFAARGFHATSTKEITEGAGLSSAALYVHFPSKEELLFTISRIGHDAFHNYVVEATNHFDRPPERLFALMESWTVWHAVFRKAARAIQRDISAMNDEHRAEVIGQRARTERFVEMEVENGIASGDFAPLDAHAAALMLYGVGIDIVRWFRHDGKYSVEELGRLYAGMYLRMLLGDEINLRK